MSYNGYTNYETWAVGMFLDGNYTGEYTYRDVLDIARDVCDEITEDSKYASKTQEREYALADRLKDYLEQECFGDEAPASIATDLLGAALSEVNWRELAEAKLQEVTEHETA